MKKVHLFFILAFFFSAMGANAQTKLGMVSFYKLMADTPFGDAFTGPLDAEYTKYGSTSVNDSYTQVKDFPYDSRDKILQACQRLKESHGLDIIHFYELCELDKSETTIQKKIVYRKMANGSFVHSFVSDDADVTDEFAAKLYSVFMGE